MRDTAFIVTKPLQILVALSIIKQLDVRSKAHLVIVDKFFNASLIYERMKSIDWEFSKLSIKFCASHREAYRFIITRNIKNIFIDSDVGFKNYLHLLRLKINRRSLMINIYEEGLGTYRKDLYSGIKKTILDFMGAGTRFGGCSLTSSLYLCRPEDYLVSFPECGNGLEKICFGPADIIRLYFNKLADVFEYVPIVGAGGSKCYVYLSSWEVSNSFLEKFFALSGDKFLKIHPNIKDDLSMSCNNEVILVPRHAPAELLVIDLEKKYREIVVFHEGSSVSRYVSSNKISFLPTSDVFHMSLKEPRHD